jgi:hypothetical protein
MFNMSKKTELRRGPVRKLSDSEALLFVSQTLQSRSCSQETPNLPVKLQMLKDILDRQEIDLLAWPNSPSKDRFYASHLKAKRLVAELAEDCCSAATANVTDQARSK